MGTSVHGARDSCWGCCPSLAFQKVHQRHRHTPHAGTEGREGASVGAPSSWTSGVRRLDPLSVSRISPDLQEGRWPGRVLARKRGVERDPHFSKVCDSGLSFSTLGHHATALPLSFGVPVPRPAPTFSAPPRTSPLHHHLSGLLSTSPGAEHKLPSVPFWRERTFGCSLLRWVLSNGPRAVLIVQLRGAERGARV